MSLGITAPNTVMLSPFSVASVGAVRHIKLNSISGSSAMLSPFLLRLLEFETTYQD